MSSDFQLKRLVKFTENALRDLSGNGQQRTGTKLVWADRLAIVAGFAGARPKNQELLGRTLLMSFYDPLTEKISCQTAPMRDFGINPFSIEEADRSRGVLRAEDICTDGLPQTEWPVSFGANFLRNKNHHFTQADRHLRHLPVTLGANPRTFCENCCPGCSRFAMGFLEQMPPDFIETHVRQVAADFERRFPEVPKSELKYIGLMTGSPLSSDSEIGMVQEVIETYKRHGFTAGFAVFSHLIESEEDMRKIADAGVIGFVVTMETFDDMIRRRCWDGKKASRTLKEYLEILERAKKHFRFVEATLVLGQESYAEIEKGVRTLADIGVAASPAIPRSYNLAQLSFIHADVWEMGLPYFTGSLELVLDQNSRIPNTPRYMRDLALDYMRRKNPETKDSDLPYKYRC